MHNYHQTASQPQATESKKKGYCKTNRKRWNAPPFASSYFYLGCIVVQWYIK